MFKNLKITMQQTPLPLIKLAAEIIQARHWRHQRIRHSTNHLLQTHLNLANNKQEPDIPLARPNNSLKNAIILHCLMCFNWILIVILFVLIHWLVNISYSTIAAAEPQGNCSQLQFIHQLKAPTGRAIQIEHALNSNMHYNSNTQVQIGYCTN